MSAAHLTSAYRPQRFSDVVGQRTTREILSRASLTGRVASAYLFSGTRGVGKTTLARIFAKALNCATAPTAEPCNECRFCRQITQGAAADVIEIDGASNRGIEQARKLKEDVGFAPLDCRYKVIIIDEAHMLTREAFNALLKTLEEPPRHVVFILATTEPHKFPATIVSRCQHFSFSHIPAPELETFLLSIVARENVEAESGAIRLLVRRGAGSARDSLSLLGQALALGGSVLEEAKVRSVLGLAGSEVLQVMVRAVAAGDCLTLSREVRSLFESGLDVGFFLRELAGVWRDLFLLRQHGEGAHDLVDFAPDERPEWARIAGSLSLPHLHACLQMTLEGQRRVLTGLEPSQGLELLLFNLALLPRLLPVNDSVVPAAASVKAMETPGPEAQKKSLDWSGFVNAHDQSCLNQQERIYGLGSARGELAGDELRITASNGRQFDKMAAPDVRKRLEETARAYFERDVRVVPQPAAVKRNSIPEMTREALEHPLVQGMIRRFDATLAFVEPAPETTDSEENFYADG